MTFDEKNGELTPVTTPPAPPEKHGMTHYEYSIAKLGKDADGLCKCTPQDWRSGSCCFRCGYDPEQA